MGLAFVWRQLHSPPLIFQRNGSLDWAIGLAGVTTCAESIWVWAEGPEWSQGRVSSGLPQSFTQHNGGGNGHIE